MLQLGTKLLGKDAKIASRLLRRVLQGKKLTRWPFAAGTVGKGGGGGGDMKHAFQLECTVTGLV
jgi:hypothetical protein